ncbi:TLD-domain containing nucleolar protein [Striga hermonthica]|uniref:TLD-domain containing nucleolar protein n=1 Tax=Striga hermonthica TaxID=68872 RepID=A0A9N7MLH4_STRHE|nr:TLD-domain containing nucleolar protein [Striga hermonthica]
MGQSSSREQEVSPELREVQSLAASTGALPSLEKTFSLLSDPQTKSIPVHSLRKCFDLTFENSESEQDNLFKEAPLLFSHLGSAIIDLFFVADKDGVNWIEFLRGYTKCCARTAASTSFNNLFRIFYSACSKAGLSIDLQFEMHDDDDFKIKGSLSPRDILVLLWFCWIFSWDSRAFKLKKSRGKCSLPDITHLVLSAVEACAEDYPELIFWDSNVSELDIKLPAMKVHLWALKNLPNLADCFVQFFHARLCYFTIHEVKSEQSGSSTSENSSSGTSKANLLTPGRAWAISLTLRGSLHEEILKVCFPSDLDEANEILLYRSSAHGKGLNRFWSNVEGYNGPLLVLIAACEEKNDARRWIIGALTNQGFENKEVFYGTSGSLYALSPLFHALLSSGREKNFVYSHLHPTGRVYDAHPKPVGVGFGGNIGNERLFMDEDFARITVRHHAVDKTYQHGTLFPSQGYLPVDASVLEVEVWGLGGVNALKIQASYKKREQLFTEQRRKIDLKTFANWEDSPEKMMMDMMSNPNEVKREDR